MNKFSSDNSKFTVYTADKDENHGDLNKFYKADISSKNITRFEIDPDIESVKLPKIDFCEPLEKPLENYGFNNKNNDYPRISDLCESEREKLRHLITEIIRSKSVHKKRNNEIQKLISDNRKKTEIIMQLEQDLAAFKLGCSSKENDIKFLTDAHQLQENALKTQILEFQKTIILLTKEKLNLEIEIQKLKKENEYLNNSTKSMKIGKQEFFRKYIALKEKLKLYSEIHKQIDNKQADCTKCLINDSKNLKLNNEIATNSCLDQLLNCKDDLQEKEAEIYPNEDALISKLFFLPVPQTLPDLQLFTDI